MIDMIRNSSNCCTRTVKRWILLQPKTTSNHQTGRLHVCELKHLRYSPAPEWFPQTHIQFLSHSPEDTNKHLIVVSDIWRMIFIECWIFRVQAFCRQDTLNITGLNGNNWRWWLISMNLRISTEESLRSLITGAALSSRSHRNRTRLSLWNLSMLRDDSWNKLIITKRQ